MARSRRWQQGANFDYYNVADHRENFCEQLHEIIDALYKHFRPSNEWFNLLIVQTRRFYIVKKLAEALLACAEAPHDFFDEVNHNG